MSRSEPPEEHKHSRGKFVHGSPCPGCVALDRAYQREYRRTHPEYQREYRRTHPEYAHKEAARARARGRALTRLSRLYPADFKALYGEELARCRHE